MANWLKLIVQDKGKIKIKLEKLIPGKNNPEYIYTKSKYEENFNPVVEKFSYK